MEIGRASKGSILAGGLLKSSAPFKSLPRSRKGSLKSRRCQGRTLFPRCGIRSRTSSRSPSSSFMHRSNACKSSSKKDNNETAAAGSKRSAEGEEIDETESLSTKAARTDSSIENIMRLQSSGEEGICVIPPQCKCIVLSHCCPLRSSNALHMLFLHRCELAAHARRSCCGSKLLSRVTAQLI